MWKLLFCNLALIVKEGKEKKKKKGHESVYNQSVHFLNILCVNPKKEIVIWKVFNS